MNLGKIRDLARRDPEALYLKEAAKRLEKILGSWLNYEESMTLMDIVQLYTLEFKDGFIVNDDSDPHKIIGIPQAAELAGCFTKDPDQEWDWWKAKYPSHDKTTEQYLNTCGRLLLKILRHPSVRAVRTE